MASKLPTVALESGLDLRKVVTTGSVLHINDVYDEGNYTEPDKSESKHVDILGKPVPNFAELEMTMFPVDENAYVKKKIIEEGGGLPLYDVYTVSVAFSGYWENDLEPFDSRKLHKPLVVDLKENGLLPGLQLAIRSMLVGETSLFLFSHHVMYGEMGIPPRIRPKSKCAFYIKLIKSILTSQKGHIDFSEPNQFYRVLHEAQMLYCSAGTLYRTNNFPAAIQLFRKAVSILHKCRLADECEEKIQERMLVKIYQNLAVAYNRTKQPLKTCTVCNELNRLSCLWNNAKALFQNAKALRMIGEFDIAEKRLKRAYKLSSQKRNFYAWQDNFFAEIEALDKARESCNQIKLVQEVSQARSNFVTDDFKREVDSLIRNFKENADLCKLIMPSGLNSSEVAYIKERCIHENLFFNKIRKEFSLEDEENVTNVKNILNPEENYALDKFEDRISDSIIENESSQEESSSNSNDEDDDKNGEGDDEYEEDSKEENNVYEERSGEQLDEYEEESKENDDKCDEYKEECEVNDEECDEYKEECEENYEYKKVYEENDEQCHENCEKREENFEECDEYYEEKHIENNEACEINNEDSERKYEKHEENDEKKCQDADEDYNKASEAGERV